MPTETEVLYWELPKKMVDELGFELYNEGDVVYIEEIHFDTQNVLFSFNTKNEFGVETNYDDTTQVPSRFEGYKPIGAEGPFIIKPEFVNGELNKSIDEYITDLTQKGLL